MCGCSFCLGLKHDRGTGQVLGVHEVFGDVRGKLQEGVLRLTTDGRAHELEPAPEPEQLSDESTSEDDLDEKLLHCQARVLPSADKTKWIIVGEWFNLPRPVGTTAQEAPSATGFIAHISETQAPAVQFVCDSSSSESYGSD